jgi:hypothetical protein
MLHPSSLSYALQFVRSHHWTVNILENKPVAKRWLCKQRPVLGNVGNIHVRNNRTGLCKPFISNGSVNTDTIIWVLSDMMFSIWAVQSGYKEEFIWESAVSSHYKNCLKSHEAKWPLEFVDGKYKRYGTICHTEPGLTEALYILYCTYIIVITCKM